MFLNSQIRPCVESYINGLSKKVVVSYQEPEDQDYWTVNLELHGGTEKNAKTLSRIDGSIVSQFHPITLINESSEYYNEHLYPLVNQFERLLREYLYIKAAMCDSKDVKTKIFDLEKKTFGEIGELLFSDRIYIQRVRQMVKHG